MTWKPDFSRCTAPCTASLILFAASLAHGQVRTQGDQEAAQRAFQPEQAVYSRIAGDELPDGPGPSAAELAPSLGLVEDGEDHGTPVWRHDRTGMRFVFVPGGTFQMGSHHRDLFQHVQVVQSAALARLEPNYFDREQPVEEVYVSPFFMGLYEVTVGEYRPFLADAEAGKVEPFEFPLLKRGVSHTPSLWDQDLPFWEDRQPVVGISWMSAYAFCGWMGGRLPSEAEWEKAARGPDGRVFPWGNRFSVMRANINTSINGHTLPVGMFPGGRSPYGCYNMAGNVQEYCLDAFEFSIFRHRKLKDHCLLERYPPEPRRVVRGASWNETGLVYQARTTNRASARMDQTGIMASTPIESLCVGFRVALSPWQDLYPEGLLDQYRDSTQKADDESPDGGNDEDDGSDDEDGR